MKIVFNWRELKDVYPDPNTTIILKTVLEGPPPDILYRIGHLSFNQQSQTLMFSGSMIDTTKLECSYKTDTILYYRMLDKYVWDYYTIEWEKLEHISNIIELLDIS